MSSLRPIEIIGGGLAGLSLGLALRRAGAPVTLIEAGHYPRHRVCGDFITGLSASTIATLGLAPYLADALQHREVAWFHREKLTRFQRLPTPALGLSRHALDARLAAAFIAAGGDLRTDTRAADFAPSPGRIIATGRARSDSPWLGLKLHVRGMTLTRDLELHLGDECYVGLALVETGAVNICGLFRRRALSAPGPALLIAYLKAAGLTALATRIHSATPEPDSFCAVAALDYTAPPVEPDIIRLGDAHGLIPPFTGNGMALAFQSAETTLAPLLTYAHGKAEWSDTCQITATALRCRFRVRLLAARTLHPFLLRPRRQHWLATLTHAHLLPLRPLYALLH
jgi:2-polyprenyl-6-methoxyphenol hydroxylase-like FAD-dependent oxidoreductase